MTVVHLFEVAHRSWGELTTARTPCRPPEDLSYVVPDNLEEAVRAAVALFKADPGATGGQAPQNTTSIS